MPRPAARARPTAAGASSASAEGRPTSIQPRAATHVSAKGTAAIVHARAAHPKRHPRPMTSASAPTTRKAQPSGAAPIDPVSKRRICPNESVPGPAGAMPANPDQSAPGRATPRAHGTLSTNATATPPTATPSARNDPRTPPARMLASTMQSATPSTSAATNGVNAIAIASTRPSPSTSPFQPACSERANGASPLARANLPTTHGMTA